jgi:general secretion pathway protein A
MYTAFYNLDCAPFDNAPDPRFFFASGQHREALAAIEYTIRMRKGFVMLTGTPGLGKTLIATVMADRCQDAALICRIMHGHRTGDELLRQVLRVLHVAHAEHDDHATRLEHLHAHLTAQIESYRPVVLLVDEAQTLSDHALEELRLLTNFDTAQHRPIQVILIGDPSLRRRLRAPRLAALRQRIAMSKQLEPLSCADTSLYIEHRLEIAMIDARQPRISFSAQAVAAIDKFASGRPRLINLVCDNALLLGFVGQVRDQITEAMVQQVLHDMLPSLDVVKASEPVIVAGRVGPEALSRSQVA